MTTYRPPTGRARSYGGRPQRSVAAEPRSVAIVVSPAKARARWRDLCDAAGWDTATPEAAGERMALALRQLDGAPFPLDVGDPRGLFAPAVLDQMRLYARATNADTRRRAAPVIAAGARMLRDLLIEQGADLAAEARARTGQRDD